MIQLTEKATQKIQSMLTRRGSGIGIRIGVKTTGCSGLSYVLEYVDTLNVDDKISEFNGFTVCIDPKSSIYLTGMTVDYVRKGLNEGFDFINPNERNRCGCGESFKI
jgi:iron-sulfur cluster assembly protein